MKTLNVLSFGAGTQSTALLLLAAEQKVAMENQTTIFDFIESDQTLNECDGHCFL